MKGQEQGQPRRIPAADARAESSQRERPAPKAAPPPARSASSKASLLKTQRLPSKGRVSTSPTPARSAASSLNSSTGSGLAEILARSRQALNETAHVGSAARQRDEEGGPDAVEPLQRTLRLASPATDFGEAKDATVEAVAGGTAPLPQSPPATQPTATAPPSAGAWGQGALGSLLPQKARTAALGGTVLGATAGAGKWRELVRRRPVQDDPEVKLMSFAEDVTQDIVWQAAHSDQCVWAGGAAGVERARCFFSCRRTFCFFTRALLTVFFGCCAPFGARAMLEVFRRHLNTNKHNLEEPVMVKRLMELAGDLGLPLTAAQLTDPASPRPQQDAASKPAPALARDPEVSASTTKSEQKAPRSWVALAGGRKGTTGTGEVEARNDQDSRATAAADADGETRPKANEPQVPPCVPAPAALPTPQEHASQEEGDDDEEDEEGSADGRDVSDEPDEPDDRAQRDTAQRDTASPPIPAAGATARAQGSSLRHSSTVAAPASVDATAAAEAQGAESPSSNRRGGPPEAATYRADAAPALDNEPQLPQPKLPTPMAAAKKEPEAIPATQSSGAVDASRVTDTAPAEAAAEPEPEADTEASLNATASSLTEDVLAEALSEAHVELLSNAASPTKPEVVISGPSDE